MLIFPLPQGRGEEERGRLARPFTIDRVQTTLQFVWFLTYHKFRGYFELPLEELGCDWSAVDGVLPGWTKSTRVICRQRWYDIADRQGEGGRG